MAVWSEKAAHVWTEKGGGWHILLRKLFKCKVLSIGGFSDKNNDWKKPSTYARWLFHLKFREITSGEQHSDVAYISIKLY